LTETGEIIALLLVGYILGSISFAQLLTRNKGVDLFTTGTGNPGAANVFRKVDKKLGIAVYVGDAFKGAAPVVAARVVTDSEIVWIATLAAAIIGHWYPVFNRFKGGAGLATGSGGVFALMPLVGVLGFASGALVIARSKSSGHGAAVGLAVMVILATPLGYSWELVVGSVVLAAVLLAKAAARGWRPGRKN
jgi:glycerol-3-phosphate acyltransferase PlsY